MDSYEQFDEKIFLSLAEVGKTFFPEQLKFHRMIKILEKNCGKQSNVRQLAITPAFICRAMFCYWRTCSKSFASSNKHMAYTLVNITRRRMFPGMQC